MNFVNKYLHQFHRSHFISTMAFKNDFQQLSLILREEVKNYITLSLKISSEQQRDTVTENMLKSLGMPPLFTTLRVNTLSQLGKKGIESAVTDYVRKQYYERGWEMPNIYYHPVADEVLIVEGRGPILSLDVMKNEMIVDMTCGMAVLRGADVFAMGIIGAIGDIQKGDKVSVFADLDGKCLKGSKEYSGKKMFLGNGISQHSRQTLFKSNDVLRGVGIKMTDCIYQCPSLADLHPELVFPQNLPSVVCSKVLQPQPGETILDMCAAPGGKTCHIATLMKNKGRVVALDKKMSQKITKISQTAQDWGLTIVEAYSCDSRSACSQDSEMSGAPPYPEESFDKVMLDAPCSALGQRPSCRNNTSLSSVQSFPQLQKSLFCEAIKLLKPGGVLVYSTCTITLQENEQQVAWALKSFPTLQLETQIPHIGGTGRQCEGLTAEAAVKLQFFDPSVLSGSTPTPDNDTIGFFIAKFRKLS